MKRLELIHEGRMKVATIERVGSTFWMHLDGETYAFQDEKKGRRKKSGAGEDESGEVRSPMPGKITQIRVKNGDAVQPQQVVIVMEAMKMEYSLKAPRAGVVATIQAKVGDQVQVDQVLLSFQPKAGAK